MRRGSKVLMWLVLGPILLLLVLVLTWLPFNGRWADAEPQPVPALLQPQAVTLAPADNAFFDGLGLQAPAGESPNAWGQRSWSNPQSSDTAPLAMPSGKDWDCNPHTTNCIAHWRSAAAALTQKMVEARLYGERCQGLAARPALQEPVPTGELMPRFSPLTNCLRWLHIEAVLAPDAQRAQRAWARADALLRRMAAGTQTLIGQAITWASATRHQLVLAQWAAVQPAGYDLPDAWLAPLPDRLLEPRIWMAAESQFQRDMTADLSRNAEQMYGAEPNALQAWAARHSLGYLPELTAQTTTDYWLADMRAFGHLQGLALAQQVRGKAQQLAGQSWWQYLRWRNTLGHVLVAVGWPAFENYALRQADLVVQQAALRFSQQLNAVPAAQRAPWWAKQQMDAGLRERIRLEGDALLVRTWRGEVEPAYKAPLRFPLRPT